jgi:hypothetical protein
MAGAVDPIVGAMDLMAPTILCIARRIVFMAETMKTTRHAVLALGRAVSVPSPPVAGQIVRVMNTLKGSST